MSGTGTWRWRATVTALVTTAAIAALAGVVARPAGSAAADDPAWSWRRGAIHGGGFAQVISTDPFHAGGAAVGGDSWGIYTTATAGDDWQPAMRGLGITGTNDVAAGDLFVMGMAYSRKFPGRVYVLTGRLEGAAAGNFGYVEGDHYTVLSRKIRGGESKATCGSRDDRPRCTGNRVLVDLDPASGIEYLYVATGNGGGVQRSSDGGVTWAPVGLVHTTAGITGMTLDPTDVNTLYVGTNKSKAYKLTGIRTAAPVTAQLTAAPLRIEEMASVGTGVYAAASTSGVFRVSNGGKTWTKLGGSFFPSTFKLAAIGGAGNTLYAGGVKPTRGKSLAKSTNGGTSWSWVPTTESGIDPTPWGTTGAWWLYTYRPQIALGCFAATTCTFESASIAVDRFDPNVVYTAGRSGVWKSEDGGSTWRPAVNLLGGTMHDNIAVATDGSVSVDDEDWIGETTTDDFVTVRQAAPPDLGAASLSLVTGDHDYEVVLSVPRDITVDGTSVADDLYRAAAIRPTDLDVSADGNTIYVALEGGGVLVGHRASAP
jgi:hypothetical protein